MRRLLFVISAICITIAASSQTHKTNTSGNSNTSSGQAKITNGDVYLHTVKGKYKIYATYVNSKVTGYYALDSNGKKIPARIMTKPDKTNTTAKKLKCYTCVKVVDTSTGKIAEDCTEVSCPDSITGEKATTNTTQ